MSKTYTLKSTACAGGVHAGWSSATWGDYYAVGSRRAGSVDFDSYTNYYATYFMFDSATLATLKTKTVTSITLTVNVTGGTGIEGSTGTSFPVRAKANANTSGGETWRGGDTILGYCRRASGSSTTFSIPLSTTVPDYGYVIGPYGATPGQDRFQEFGTVETNVYATLVIVTNEVDLTLSYNANGGSGAPSAQTGVGSPSYTFTISSSKPTRANASAGSYTVTYNANSGSVSPTSATAARTTSYSFSKWNTASGGGGTNYNPGGSITISSNTTLYAQWTSSTSTAAVTLPTPSRTGYSFNGWYTAASGGTKAGNAGASYTPTGNVTLYAQWTATVVAPTFTTQPSAKSVYRGATATLSVVATTTQGTITYQWQSSTNNSSFSNISGATSASYSAPTSTVGTLYYRCVATATKDGVSKSTNSNSASVAVSATPTPSITSQPSSKSVNVAGTASLSVTASVASGTLSYQWYSSTDNSSFTAISGATSASYSAPTSAPGTKYYRVRVTNTLNGYTTYKDSNSVSVTVSVAAPTFTTQPTPKNVYRGASVTLSAAATAPYGTVSYQWQSSSNNSSYSNISGATSSTYSPSTATVGTTYYRCVAKATYSGSTSSATNSTAVSVVVNATGTPIITSQPQDATAFIGQTGKSVSVTATGDSLSYQWQSSTNNSTWSNVSGATGRTYSFPTSSAGTTYYRCVVTNTLNGYTATTTSSVATVSVVDVTTPSFTKQPQSASYAIGNTANALSVTATSNGSLTYQWQRSSNNSTWSNISGATSTS